MSDIGEEPEEELSTAENSPVNESDVARLNEDEEQQQTTTPRNKRRRRMATGLGRNNGSPIVLLDDMSGLLAHYSVRVEDQDGDGDEDVGEVGDSSNVELLVPRLVLERVTVGGRRSSSPKKKGKHNKVAKNDKVSSSRVLFPDDEYDQASRETLEKGGESRQKAAGGESAAKKSQIPLTFAAVATSSSGKPKEKKVKEVISPGTSESQNDFTRRLLNVDPLEGPSWLFESNNKAKTTRLAKDILSRIKQSETNSQRKEKENVENVTKKLGKVNDTSAGNSSKKKGPKESHKVTSTSQANSDNKSPKDSNKKRKMKEVDQENFLQEETKNDSPPQKPKKRTRFADSLPSSKIEESKLPSSEYSARRSVPPTNSDNNNMTVEGENEGRPRRRAAAAAAAAGSFKEMSLNAKLRQGDPNTESVYSDYVPQIKGKEGLKKRRSKKK